MCSIDSAIYLGYTELVFNHGCLNGMPLVQICITGSKCLFCKAGYRGQQLNPSLAKPISKAEPIFFQRQEPAVCVSPPEGVFESFKSAKYPAASRFQPGGVGARGWRHLPFPMAHCLHGTRCPGCGHLRWSPSP